jgi:ABC-2 type transport system ATP-binding protein
MAPIVEIAGVVKRYRDVCALQGVDLVLDSGRVHALLGPNGAGKTTLVRLLATLLAPDAGWVRVAGVDTVRQARQVRRMIGLAGQHAAVEPAMTGRENLRMVGRLCGLTRRQTRDAADDVLERLGLTEVAHRRVSAYSGGLRRRLDLGASLVGRPRLLLLDEPTTGLDPVSRHQLWDAIASLVRAGTDVLLTTQYLEEADLVADHIVILKDGRVVADGSPAELKARTGSDVVTVRVDQPADLDGVQKVFGAAGRHAATIDRMLLTATWATSDGGADAARALHQLAGGGVRVAELTVRRPSLDEVFLRLVAATVGSEEEAGSR